jgi:hypothetical protein
MIRISPGKEEEFRYLQEWLSASAALEQVIEATEGNAGGMTCSGNGLADNALSQPAGSFGMLRV